MLSSHGLSWLKMGSRSKILAILADNIVVFLACLSVRYSCNYSALLQVDESKATKNDITKSDNCELRVKMKIICL